jgi:hypothetical protein
MTPAQVIFVALRLGAVTAGLSRDAERPHRHNVMPKRATFSACNPDDAVDQFVMAA